MAPLEREVPIEAIAEDLSGLSAAGRFGVSNETVGWRLYNLGVVITPPRTP